MRRSVHEFMVAMKDSGLSTSQLNTLMRLHYRGSCPVSGISDELGLTAAAASQIVDRLGGMGVIERTEDPKDRRGRQVRLTAQGRGLVAPGEVERMKSPSRSPARGASARGALPRAIRYLGHYRRDTALAYAALLLATGAQLMVPLLIQRMIDGVTRGVVSQETASLPR